ncbi:MAG: two-component system, chemotaxis family, response regulator CheB [Bacteroidetes bacterium]|nr:MAG: two-component system, chemotaxis family, response regulator CheB [Bacteroidota bacterium]
MKYEAIVIGASSGGLNALTFLFSALPPGFSIPIIVVQHVGSRSDSQWIDLLNDKSKLHIKEADEKEKIEPGHTYIAPPNYHLLVEKDKTFSLAASERVNFARPSIDVLFESAAEAYKDKLIGIILTGSNADGTAGMQKVKACGGLAIVQDPETAESPLMPASVIANTAIDYVLPLENIINLLLKLY